MSDTVSPRLFLKKNGPFCHSERSEESDYQYFTQILRCAKNDKKGRV